MFKFFDQDFHDFDQILDNLTKMLKILIKTMEMY